MTLSPPLEGVGRVYLTGGTGFIGSHIAEALRAAGHPVRALYREEGSGSTRLRALGCELVEGRLEDGIPALRAGMEGCSALVHAAALMYGEHPWPRLREINVGGSERVFQAGSDLGIRVGVHLSSVAVYGGAAGPLDEDSPTDTPLHPSQGYARSKRESERLVGEVARQSGMAVTLLRPSAVFGERDPLFTTQIARFLHLPLHPLLGGGRTTLAAVYVGNLADAAVRILAMGAGSTTGLGHRDPARPAPPLNLSGEPPLTQRVLLEGLAHRLGLPFRPLPLPAGLVRLGARIGMAVGAKVPGAEGLSLVRAAALALAPNPYRSDLLRRTLDWTPPIGLEEALDRTASWIRESGLGPRDPRG